MSIKNVKEKALNAPMRLPVYYALLLFMGCSTMNKSECLTANWELIGLEDGSQGRALSYANKRQSTCGKHNVNVNVAAYRQGHREGAEQYCKPANGFTEGKRGRSYNGICPSDLELDFLEEYKLGLQFHDQQSNINSIKSEINHKSDDIERLNREIDRKESIAAQNDISREQRAVLLLEVNRLRYETLNQERELIQLEFHLKEEKNALNDLEYIYDK